MLTSRQGCRSAFFYLTHALNLTPRTPLTPQGIGRFSLPSSFSLPTTQKVWPARTDQAQESDFAKGDYLRLFFPLKTGKKRQRTL